MCVGTLIIRADKGISAKRKWLTAFLTPDSEACNGAGSRARWGCYANNQAWDAINVSSLIDLLGFLIVTIADESRGTRNQDRGWPGPLDPPSSEKKAIVGCPIQASVASLSGVFRIETGADAPARTLSIPKKW
jgi:hypothetical protein